MKTIKVTQDDIEKGESCECFSCPVALAVLRSDKRIQKVSAGEGMISLHYKTKITSFFTPHAVREFIHAFDQGWTWNVYPFTFTLE